MMRKLWIVLVIPVLAAAGCESEPLRRMEVWKQQTLFGPSREEFVSQPNTVMYAPPTASYAAPAAEMDLQAAPSPEAINGVLEQP